MASGLIATMDGHLEYSNGAFYVRPVLEIRGDVDYSTGNIDFIGDVQIAGDVRENFSVRATGSITVDRDRGGGERGIGRRYDHHARRGG